MAQLPRSQDEIRVRSFKAKHKNQVWEEGRNDYKDNVIWKKK